MRVHPIALFTFASYRLTFASYRREREQIFTP